MRLQQSAHFLLCPKAALLALVEYIVFLFYSKVARTGVVSLVVDSLAQFHIFFIVLQFRGCVARRKAKKKSIPFWPFGTLLFALLLFFDQYTKHAISSSYLVGESRAVFSWISFTYVQNTGTIWGMLQDANGAFVWLSIIAFGILIYYYDAFETCIEKLCYVLLMTGLWGNLLDRVARGFVVDFLDLGWWPIFNIADSAIVVGLIVYALEQWRKR